MTRLGALALVVAGLHGAAGVAVGAAAAHVAGTSAQALLRTGSDYQLWHALALVAAAAVAGRLDGWAMRLAAAAGAAFALGAALFSLSLYWAAYGGRAALAPFGGSLLILGWLLLAAAGVGAAVRAGRRGRGFIDP